MIYQVKEEEVLVTVWDATGTVGSVGESNIEFRAGAMYLIHQVEDVGLYDQVGKGYVQYESNNVDKVREIGPPLKMHMTSWETPSQPPDKSEDYHPVVTTRSKRHPKAIRELCTRVGDKCETSSSKRSSAYV
ncbi:hypothetical protein PC117_g13433 [Phytophthora cactorum]|uniref:Uncharacterized protein n=1 Tax=Phytophthora cactorum TaxID=29920 RepID=A0A8T1D174_9STRA|nr:hypothetical protein PC117_g13433 [Phytophthora cactorum]